MPELWRAFGPLLGPTLVVGLCLLASGHALLQKRDVRAAIGWVAVIWLVPIAGAALYFIFGINRIQRRASRLRPVRPVHPARAGALGAEHAELARALPEEARHLEALASFGDRLSGVPLVGGNTVVPLDGGDVAYAAMLEAIDGARRSLALSTYIFDHDKAGLRFADALGRAVARGVEVRVLIDGLGSLYSRRSMTRELERRGIRTAKFLYSYIPWRMAYLNLRNHRKILVADGRIGFTGGINIRAGHLKSLSPRHLVHDLHFKLEGPVVAEMMDVFAEDWLFTTGERLAGEAWHSAPEATGTVFARAIAAGPDEDLERLSGTLLGALTLARRSVRIVTPYLLPDRTLIAGFRLATLRGVEVDLAIPSASNLPFVDWATTTQLPELIDMGCRIWLTPRPFDHSKLMVVDGAWSLVGSTNWDPRSLRLNFEFNVECFDGGLAAMLEKLIDRRLEGARRLTRSDLDERSLAVKLRDGIAWLFSPYL